MPESPESPFLLTKVRAPSTASRGAPSRIPPVLLQKVPSRLQALGVWYVAAMGIVWIGVNVAEGHFIQEFDRLGQWLPPTLGMLTALIMLAITWSPSVGLESKLKAGLVFQVVISYTIAFGVHWGAFRGLTAQDIDGDRIGLSPVAMWMLAFAALVPARPRSALVALLGSATAIPVAYALSVREGLAPSLAPIAFFTIFCLPYIITAIIAYVTAHIVFNLGQDVRRARELGSYRLRDPLGQGGMGQVWRADHSMLARPAAIKLIKPEALEGDPTQVQAAIARFEREAQITASLESPHSVKLYDFGHTDDGTLYYVMELLEGIDLQSMVERFGAIPAERAVSLLAQACHSLAEAHRRGLIHRDIKPANLFVCRWAFEHDFLKVLDFGLAKHRSPSAAATAPDVTQANHILGTPAYLAPEIARGNCEPDERVDIYALGCVACWLLTGRALFEGTSVMEVVAAHVKDRPLPMSERLGRALPEGLDELVLACLEKEPGRRPESAQALAEGLAAIPVEAPWSPDRASEWWQAHDQQLAEGPQR